jgi:hypothetical protein
MLEDRGFFSKPQRDALQQYKGETEERRTARRYTGGITI